MILFETLHAVEVWMGLQIVLRSVDGNSGEMHVYSGWFILLAPYISSDASTGAGVSMTLALRCLWSTCRLC